MPAHFLGGWHVYCSLWHNCLLIVLYDHDFLSQGQAARVFFTRNLLLLIYCVGLKLSIRLLDHKAPELL